MNMTHDEMIAVIQAHKEGREIELSAPGDTWAPTTWDLKTLTDRILHGYCIRVKPTPKKRTMRLEELPAVFWVRPKGSRIWFLPTSIGDNFYYQSGGQLEVGVIAKEFTGYEWSPDRKEVRSFEVEDV